MKTSYLKCCPAVRKLIYINFLTDVVRGKMSDIGCQTSKRPLGLLNEDISSKI